MENLKNVETEIENLKKITDYIKILKLDSIKAFKKIIFLHYIFSAVCVRVKKLEKRIDKIDKFNQQGKQRNSICEPYKQTIIEWHKQGYSSYKIASQLNLSQKTIINYLKKEGVI